MSQDPSPNTATRDQRFEQIARALGYPLDAALVVGGHYVPAVRHGGEVWVSGQVPRVGTTVAVTGRVGAATSLDEARRAARICAVRALHILQQTLGSLDAVQRVLRVGVFVQCTEDFTQQSEVADAASDLLYDVFGEVGTHARTAVGVYQLPKNASVELELVAAG